MLAERLAHLANHSHSSYNCRAEFTESIRSSLSENFTIPAVVIGTGLTALGVLRALGDANIPRLSVSHNPGYCSASRFYKPLSVNGQLFRDGDNLESYLLSLPLTQSVLIPCSDNAAKQIAMLGDRYQGRFFRSLPILETLEVVADKWSFAQFCQLHRLPHPDTKLLTSTEDLDVPWTDENTFRFLKPCNSQEFFKQFKVKAFRVRSRQDAAEKLSVAQASGMAMVMQEYIPGPATNHYFIDGFIDRFGEIRALFPRRRIRMYPPDFGNSTFMTSVAKRDVLPALETVSALVRALKFRGVFSVELKFDPRDSLYKILELNPRPWWFVGYAAAAGVDVVSMSYLDALERPVQTLTSYKQGYSCVHPYYDFHACLALYRAGDLSLGEWLSSWVFSHQTMFALSDPGPSLRWGWDYLRQRSRSR